MEKEQFFYRFRTLKHIFEYKELENLEIYFASNEELNDPMEAYKTVIFQGDNIMWYNLFKNYIVCLSRFMLANELKGNPNNLMQLDIFDILRPFNDKTYTKIYYDLFINIYNKFREYFSEDIDNIFCKHNKITEEMLKIYLLVLNNIIVNIIGMYYYKCHIKDINRYIENNKQMTIDILNSYKSNFENNTSQEYINIIAKQYCDELLFPPLTNRNQFQFNNELSHYIFSGRFVDEYINYLTDFVRFKTYSASFNTDFTNPVMWSHYTDNHNGVCLIYKNIDNKMELFKDENIIKTNAPKNIAVKFQQIKYKFKDYPINFFYSFLSSNTEILDYWYKDILTNKTSNLYDNYMTNEQYLQNGKNLIALPLYKTKHWKYEKEYRLILEERNILEKQDRKYKYDFNYLDGIIFGIKTPLNKKLEIIDIIRNLCEKYKKDFKTFNFYQAFLEIKYQKINYYKIDVIYTPHSELNHE